MEKEGNKKAQLKRITVFGIILAALLIFTVLAVNPVNESNDTESKTIDEIINETILNSSIINEINESISESPGVINNTEGGIEEITNETENETNEDVTNDK